MCDGLSPTPYIGTSLEPRSTSIAMAFFRAICFGMGDLRRRQNENRPERDSATQSSRPIGEYNSVWPAIELVAHDTIWPCAHRRHAKHNNDTHTTNNILLSDRPLARTIIHILF